MADVNDYIVSVAVGNSATYKDCKGQLYSVFTNGSVTGSIAINTSGNVSYKILETNDLSLRYFPSVYNCNNAGATLSGTAFSITNYNFLNDNLVITCSGIASAVTLKLRYVIV